MDKKEDFLAKLELKLVSRNRVENFYKILRIVLMVLITICGFLTATASQSLSNKNWISSSTSILIFGLVSAICAVLNQTLNPSEKSLFHKNVKKAFQKIQIAVEYGGLEIPKAARLQAIAITEPEEVFKEMLENKLGD